MNNIIYNATIQQELDKRDAAFIKVHNENVDLKAELHQQRFNNKHNLSIDQKIADKIESQAKTIEEAKKLLRVIQSFFTSMTKLGYSGDLISNQINRYLEE